MSETFLTGVPSNKVRAVWPQVRPFIERALERDGCYAPEDIVDMLEARDAQLWVAVGGEGIAAALVTKINLYPRQKRCVLFLSAGELKAHLRHLPEVEAWAKAQGCDVVELNGRPGWERVMPGYRRALVTLEKDLRHG